MPFTKMQMRNVHMMHMSLFRGAIFVMQMSHAMVQMQRLSMMVPAHIFNCDANVSLQGWRCKNFVVQMPPCRYAMMQMPPCGYIMIQMLLGSMPWCKCLLESMPWCEYPLGSMSWRECLLVGMQWMQMPLWVCNECECPLGYAMNANAPCGYIMTRMLWCKHNLFKNSLYFQNEALSTPKTKIFSNSIYYS